MIKGTGKKAAGYLHQHPLAIIFTAWMALQVLIFIQSGIVTDFEAKKYIYEADNLLSDGRYSSGNFLFYSTQILLITLAKITGSYPWLPVMVQLALNAFSILLFFRLAQKFTGSMVRSVLVTLVFLAMYYYHLYNTYLFTESIYFSLGIIYSYFLFCMKKPGWRNMVVLFLMVSLIYFTRPTGVFFIPATIVFIILKFYRKNAVVLLSAMALAGIVLLYFLLNFALASGGEFDFLLPYLDERVICGVPTIAIQHQITIPGEKNSVEGLWYVITNYPGLFFKLAMKRFLAFWGMTRSFYSVPHNIFIAVYFYTLYALILYKIKRLLKYLPAETGYFLTVIFFVMVTVMLSCDEWHNRFILPLLPFFLLMAASLVPKQNSPHAK